MLTAGDGSAEPIEVFKFPEEVMNAAEAGGMELPFAVVGSRECDVIDDEEVPLRHFPWGTCLPLRKEHSDAVSFRCGLLLTLHCIWCGEPSFVTDVMSVISGERLLGCASLVSVVLDDVAT